MQHLYRIGNGSDSVFTLKSVHPDLVLKIIGELRNSKATGNDDIDTNEGLDEDDRGDGSFDNKKPEEVNDWMEDEKEVAILNPVEIEWHEDIDAEVKDVDNEDKDDADSEDTNYDDTKWKEGDECIARWEEDGCWYKSVVEGVTEGTAVVTFLDFGNSAYCSVELLKDKDTNIGDDGQLEVEEPQEEEWE